MIVQASVTEVCTDTPGNCSVFCSVVDIKCLSGQSVKSVIVIYVLLNKLIY